MDRRYRQPATTLRVGGLIRDAPPELCFGISAVFHYLGPSFAVLLFARVEVLGVAWMRIASAAIIFAAWRRPWRTLAALDPGGRRLLIAWGVVLVVMNACFYTAISRLPLNTVAAIEFLPVIALAALGARSRRNLLALVLAVGGVYVLTDVHLVAEPIGVVFAFAVLFALYIVLADRVAKRPRLSGIDGLACAMLIALVVITPIGDWQAAPALLQPTALLAGIGVGISSSVVPYVTDQLALARLARATYALMVALLPALATVIGIVVLAQIPSWTEVAGVALVIAGVALHRRPAQPANQHASMLRRCRRERQPAHSSTTPRLGANTARGRLLPHRPLRQLWRRSGTLAGRIVASDAVSGPDLIGGQRAAFNVPADIAYFNTANLAPQLHAVRAAGEAALERRGQPWTISAADWFSDVERLRSLFGELIGTSGEGVAIVPATSYGFAVAGRNLALRARQHVLVLKDEYPSGIYTWRAAARRSGAQIRTVAREPGQTSTDAVLAALDERVAIVSVPNVHWTDGAVIDLAAIAARSRELGARLVIDGSQSVGAMPLDIEQLRPDFLVSVGYKWLLGPFSVGYLYVAEEHRLGEPLEENWILRSGSEDFARLVDYRDEYQPGARRFDVGQRTKVRDSSSFGGESGLLGGQLRGGIGAGRGIKRHGCRAVMSG